MAVWRAIRSLAAAMLASASLAACAQLHLTQGPHQVISRTGDFDDYDKNRDAAPVAARILPYAVLTEQSETAEVYDSRKPVRLERACLADEPAPCKQSDLDQYARRANNLLGRWRLVWSCNGQSDCKTDSGGALGRVDGLGVQVWVSRGPICREAIVAFRGTVAGSFGDWVSNFHWFIRALPVYDQYDQVRDHIGAFIERIVHEPCYRDGVTRIAAIGHSLGGGLAQLAAYSDRRVRRVYTFDPSVVTGFNSVNPPNRDKNVIGLRSERLYEHGEILAYLRYFARQFIPPTPCDPRIVNVRFDLLHGGAIDQHGINDLTTAFLREARDAPPERDPVVEQPCSVGGGAEPTLAGR